MPRTRNSPDYWKLYGRDIIKKKATQKRIAERLNISQQAVSKKLETMNFTLEQFRGIVQVTGMDDKTILEITKGGIR